MAGIKGAHEYKPPSPGTDDHWAIPAPPEASTVEPVAPFDEKYAETMRDRWPDNEPAAPALMVGTARQIEPDLTTDLKRVNIGFRCALALIVYSGICGTLGLLVARWLVFLSAHLFP